MQGDLLGFTVFTHGDQTSRFRRQPSLSSAAGPIVYGAAHPRSFSSSACLDLDICESPGSRAILRERSSFGAFMPLFLIDLWIYLCLTLT